MYSSSTQIRTLVGAILLSGTIAPTAQAQSGHDRTVPKEAATTRSYHSHFERKFPSALDTSRIALFQTADEQRADKPSTVELSATEHSIEMQTGSFVSAKLSTTRPVAASADPETRGISPKNQSGKSEPRRTIFGGTDETCVWDDGMSENALGLTEGGEIAWIQECTATVDTAIVTAVSTVWGGFGQMPHLVPLTSVRVYVWSDPNQDGDPCDAVLLCETAAAPDEDSMGTDVFQEIALDPDCGAIIFDPGELYFIGASAVHTAGGYPVAMDETAPDDVSWIGYVVGGTYDPTSIGGQEPCPSNVGDIGFPSDFLLRSNAEPASDPSGCGDCPTDVDGNGNTGASDLAVLLGSWGPCAPGDACECLDNNDDDVIGAADLAVLLGSWGMCP